MNKYKKLLSILLVCNIGIICITGCGKSNVSSNNTNTSDNIAVNTNNTASIQTNHTQIELDDEDLIDSYNKDTCTIINLSGKTAEITSPGTYLISGTIDDGNIQVNSSSKGTVHLIFNGVNITSDDAAPVIISDASKVIITLVSGTQNIITDNRPASLEDDYSGAISSKAYLVINGTGNIEVNGNYRNGIKSSDDLKILSGNYKITSSEDGIVGKDCLCIKDGTFSINAGNDGMKSTYDTDESKGYVIIENGTYNITSGNDGIQSEHSLTIYGGTYNIKTGKGAAQSLSKSENMNVNPGTRFGKDFKNSTTETTSSDSNSSSIKGLKCNTEMIISGGEFVIDSEDDSIHTNGSVNISGGTFSLSSGDDGIHADELVQIDNGTITINKCYEGIESAVITINDGDISVTSSDDGLNASDGSTVQNGGRFFNMGTDAASQSTGARNNTSTPSLNITGGKLYVNSTGDGLDSNGTMSISGGEVIVEGPTTNENTALDFESSMTITGGTVYAFGSSGMLETPSSASNGCCIVTTFSTVNGNDSFTLKDSSGKIIMSYTPSKSYSAVILYSQDIKNNTEYTINAGSNSVSITTNEGVTSNAANGGFRQGGKGGSQKGMMPDTSSGSQEKIPEIPGAGTDGQQIVPENPGNMPDRQSKYQGTTGNL